jgi:hypothetical protein
MRKTFVFLGACLVTFAAAGSPAVTYPNGVTVISEVKHDLSPPLRDIPPAGLAPQHEAFEPGPLPIKLPPPGQVDPVVQTELGPMAMPAPSQSFNGQGANGSAPPDTNGDVGPNHYLQTVNTTFAVYNKTGGVVLSQRAINTIWTGFGGGCETHNDGDPVVKYDRSADRWVVSQFSVSSTPYLQCVAVSQTADPTGAWYRYSFSLGNTNFNDYPKMGVWPDAYYFSFNIFANGNTFSGAMACAYDRTRMIAGLSASAQCFPPLATEGGMLPSDLYGATPPPAGEPNFYLDFQGNSLNLFRFHVDWTTPANSTFAGPTAIGVAAFTPLCGGGTCVPQTGTAQQLDSLADRLMYRLAYRNRFGLESLVVNHSVAANGGGGIRWYEIRSPNSTPTVYQQGTFAPDSQYRWMGSIASDQDGNIAAGYSISSSSIHPTINYAGRLSADPLGTFGQGEATLFAGAGSQTGGLSRWGDYSSMSIDPSDDCTFWYTNEYEPSNGSFNWATRIGSFKFASCGSCPTPPTASASGDASICPGGSAPLTGSGGTSCLWSPPTGLSDATVCNPTASPATTTIYTLTVADAQGCTSVNSATVTVTVFAPPTANASGTATICNGASTQLTGSGGVSCSWSPAAGLDDASSCTPIASPSATTTYTLTVTDANGCTGATAGSTQAFDFESGNLNGWTIDGTNNPPVVSTAQAHGGTHSVLLGNVSGGEPLGDSAMYYPFTVPAAGGTLSFWYWPQTTDSIAYDWQDVYIEDSSGNVLGVALHACSNAQSWINVTYDLAPFAGLAARLRFLVHQDGFGDDTGMYVDDISLPVAVPAQVTVTVIPVPDATLTAPSGVVANSTGNTASVPVTAGATYTWSIVNGTITAGAGTNAITFTAGSSGTVDLSVTVTASGCSSNSLQSVPIQPVGTVLKFFTIAPCRLIDTRRVTGTWGGPPLQAATQRVFPLDGQCTIPADAVAVSANMTTVLPTAGGDLRAFPTGGPVPNSSVINFNAGGIRANNIIVPLTGSPSGSMTIQTDMPSGSTNFLFDVNGYFRFVAN